MNSLWVVLLLAVFSINICYSRHSKLKNHHHGHHNPESVYCFREEDLDNSPSMVVNHFVSSKMHWDRYSAVNMVPKLEETEKRSERRRRAPVATCPRMNTLEQGKTLNERSISPWTYHSVLNRSRQRRSNMLARMKSSCNTPLFISKPTPDGFSQWRIDNDESRYPQKLAFAHCLCNHCISSESGRETSSLNSVLVTQSMLVLRKKSCPYESTLSTFTLEYISVPVACTCSVPRY